MYTNVFFSLLYFMVGAGCAFLLSMEVVMTVVGVFLQDNQKTRIENRRTVVSYMNRAVFLTMAVVTVLFIFTGYPVAELWDDKKSQYVAYHEAIMLFLIICAVYWCGVSLFYLMKIWLRFERFLYEWTEKLDIKMQRWMNYEDKQRYVHFGIKAYKNLLGDDRGGYNLTGWVVRESKRYWYVKSDMNNKSYRIKKAKIGQEKYPVEWIEVVSNAPQV